MINSILIIVGVAFIIWRIERVKDDIRDDIAFMERVRDLPDDMGIVIKED